MQCFRLQKLKLQREVKAAESSEIQGALICRCLAIAVLADL